MYFIFFYIVYPDSMKVNTNSVIKEMVLLTLIHTDKYLPKRHIASQGYLFEVDYSVLDDVNRIY